MKFIAAQIFFKLKKKKNSFHVSEKNLILTIYTICFVIDMGLIPNHLAFFKSFQRPSNSYWISALFTLVALQPTVCNGRNEKIR